MIVPDQTVQFVFASIRQNRLFKNWEQPFRQRLLLLEWYGLFYWYSSCTF